MSKINQKKAIYGGSQRSATEDKDHIYLPPARSQTAWHTVGAQQVEGDELLTGEDMALELTHTI